MSYPSICIGIVILFRQNLAKEYFNDLLIDFNPKCVFQKINQSFKLQINYFSVSINILKLVGSTYGTKIENLSLQWFKKVAKNKIHNPSRLLLAVKKFSKISSKLSKKARKIPLSIPTTNLSSNKISIGKIRASVAKWFLSIYKRKFLRNSTSTSQDKVWY